MLTMGLFVFMIYRLTKKQLEDILEEMEIPYGEDDEGDLYTVMEADDDFAYDVVLWFTLNEEGNVLTLIARCVGLQLDDVLRVANRYNATHHFLTCIANENDRTVGFDHSVDIDGVPEEYITGNCLGTISDYVWEAYCDLL